jgi:hypothetical protein
MIDEGLGTFPIGGYHRFPLAIRARITHISCPSYEMRNTGGDATHMAAER